MRTHERVKLYIEEKGLKQKAIAQRCGIPNNIFNAMLNGKRKMYADDIIAICVALNESPETFIKIDAG